MIGDLRPPAVAINRVEGGKRGAFDSNRRETCAMTAPVCAGPRVTYGIIGGAHPGSG